MKQFIKKIWPERTRQNHNFCWRSVLHINADLGWIRKSSVMYWRNIRMVSWVDASISLLCLEHHKGCIIFYYTRHLPMNIRFSLLWPSLVWPVFLRFECYLCAWITTIYRSTYVIQYLQVYYQIIIFHLHPNM